MAIIIPRPAWPPAFPNVVVHADLNVRNNHPSFAAAKAGDPHAAKTLAEGLLEKDAIDGFEQFWRREFGHGFDGLTNIEAGYLCRAESVAAIKARMAQAAELARRSGLSPVRVRLRSSREP